jgi:hypothetical protein
LFLIEEYKHLLVVGNEVIEYLAVDIGSGLDVSRESSVVTNFMELSPS